jgi:hypothetical protein
MNNKNRAEEIAERVRDLQEHLDAWRSLATQDQSAREVARLHQLVEVDVAQVRATASYLENVDEALKAFHSSADDSALLKTLHEQILRSMSVG